MHIYGPGQPFGRRREAVDVPALAYNLKMARRGSIVHSNRKLWLLAAWLLMAQCAYSQQQTSGNLEMQTTALPKAFVRQPYHFELKAQGGVPPLNWEITSGAPPDGLGLSQDGILSGALRQRGEFHIGVTVTDSAHPAHELSQEFVLLIVAPLFADWGRPPTVVGQRIEGSVKVSNATEEDFDLTVIVVAVNGNGRATALGYQRVTLKKDTNDFEIPFGENLPPDAYQVNADAVGEVAATNSIYRAHLVKDNLQIQPVQ
jgi:hypothetical protein